MNNEELKLRKRENTKRWKAAHPEKVREHNKAYHLKHRDQRLLYFRKYHQTIRDKARKYDQITSKEAEE